MLGRWPALFTKQQVLAEFTRVASKNLENDFFRALDRFVPRLLELFKAKKGKTHDDVATRTAVLKCLPVYFGDDWAEFYKVSNSPDPAETQMPVGILAVVPEGETLDPLDPHLDVYFIQLEDDGSANLITLSPSPAPASWHQHLSCLRPLHPAKVKAVGVTNSQTKISMTHLFLLHKVFDSLSCKQ
uniref:Uncharacterized protein n=1 Tax=Knipowitschia caucasica TaxID=637954 RepID=A0AAV2K021_KNICA